MMTMKTISTMHVMIDFVLCNTDDLTLTSEEARKEQGDE